MSDDASKQFDETESSEERDEIRASVEADVVSEGDESSADDEPSPDSHEYPDLTTGAEREATERVAAKADLSKDVRQWAMFCHLGGLAGFVFPFGGIIAPLLLWQMKREESAFIDDQGREALNFNITIVSATYLVLIVSVMTMFFFVGFLLIPVVFALTIAHVAYAVIASLKANEGVAYRYPWTIRFVN